MARFLLLLVCCLLFMAVTFGQGLTDQIARQNEAMEEAFGAGDMDRVAWFYLDDATMLSPGGDPLRGREAIDGYWKRIQNPVSWDLQVIAVSTEEEDIYTHEYYQALQSKPPSWKSEGIKIAKDDNSIVYQLGRSILVTEREGTERKSIVEFILVWKYTDEGYRILVDTYSW